MAAITVPITGRGATISGFGITSKIVSIDPIKISATPLDITTLDVTGYKLMRPGDLREAPEVKVTFYWLGNLGGTAASLISGEMIPTSESYSGTTVTITFPTHAGTTTGETAKSGIFSGKAFVKEVELPSCKNGEVMTGSYTLQFDGNSIAFTTAN